MFILSELTLHGSHRPRLDALTLAVPAGRTAVVGYSGAGKTSLLNILAGFERADFGTVERKKIKATDGARETAGRLPPGRLPLYWVPQNGGLWPHLTVDQHLACVQKVQDLSDEILNALDLEERRSAFPAELSQGERSRLAMARALASQAEWLLMDEPLSHVDPVRKPAYWNVVGRWLEKNRISVMFSSHEPETVLRQADHVICLHEGRAVFQGSTRDLYHSPPSRHVGEFLGPVNWFEPDEALTFLAAEVQNGSAVPVAVRPERLCLSAEDSSALELVATPFQAAYAESIVKHVASGKSRTVLHSVFGEMPRPGQRVGMRIQ